MADITLTTFPVVYKEAEAVPVTNSLILQTEEIGGTKRIGTRRYRVRTTVGAFQFSELGDIVGNGTDNNTNPIFTTSDEPITLVVRGQLRLNFKAATQNDSFIVYRVD